MSPYYNSSFTWDGLSSQGTSQGFHSDTSKIGMTILNNFWRFFLYPNNLLQVDTINSTIFDVDCIGRVSITGIFESRELNTEYIFGLFAYNSDVEFSMIGSGTNYTIAAFAAVDNLLVASTVVNFTFPQLNNFTMPFVIDTWITYSWDDDNFGQIQSYDAVFRNFDWYYNSTVSLSASVIAGQYLANQSALLQEEIFNITNSGDQVPPALQSAAAEVSALAASAKPTRLNNTLEGEQTGPFSVTEDPNVLALGIGLLKTLTIELICKVHETYCTGTNTQYNSTSQCIDFLQTVRLGNGHEGSMNTVFCRSLHQNMIRFRPTVHCPHIGPSGGDMCTDGATFSSVVWNYHNFMPNMVYN